MTEEEKNNLVEDATFSFTIGENDEAEKTLRKVLAADNDYFPAWHSLAEVLFSSRRFEEARQAGLEALRLEPEDVHVFTSLSRIHMELGDKETAEKYGAQARMQGWKNELSEDPKQDED
ncbi:MAG: tetratricopeptide repeat protein [Opitutales bacterium]|nr:tetratricopeptide repeat protein [Opitutales bacterium]